MGQTSPLSFLIQYFIGSIFAFGLTSGNVTCSFETGFCGWNVTKDSNFEWLINTGNAGDRTSGLESDHTCGNIKGAYLYIRGQDAHNSTWVAIIQSQKIDLNETTNLTFWYHMNGNGIGTLSLYTVTSDNVTSNNISTMLWSRSGRQSPDWLEAMVSLKSGVFQLQFRATTRRHFASDIGLDDIWLLSEPKDNEGDLTDLCKIPTTTTTPTTPQKTTTTTSKPTTAPHMNPCALAYSDTDLLSGSCDFENGWCNLSELVNKIYTMKWNITSGSVGLWASKINGDHTKTNGSGKYAYLPLNYSTPKGQRAGLMTPILPYPVCLTFWYSVADKTTKLFVLLQEQDNTRTTLWSYMPPSRNWTSQIKFPQPWTKLEIPVFSTKPFSIIFQAVTNGDFSEVGIDDISIQGKPLSTFTQSRSSATSSSMHTTETIMSKLTTVSLLTRTSNIITLTTHSLPRNSSFSETTNSVNIISSTVTTEQFLTRTSSGSTTFDRSISEGSLLTTTRDQFTSISSSATKRTTDSTTSSFLSSTTTLVPTPTSVASIYNDGSTLYHVTTSNGNPYFSNPLSSTSTTLRTENLKTEHPLKSTTDDIATSEIVTYPTKLETLRTSENPMTTILKSSLITDTTKKRLSTIRYLSTSTHESVTDNQTFLAENGISIRDRNIIGGVIGGCLFVVLVVLILIKYFRKIRREEELKTSASVSDRYKVHESYYSNTDRDMNLSYSNLNLTTKEISNVDMQTKAFTVKHNFDKEQGSFVTKL